MVTGGLVVVVGEVVVAPPEEETLISVHPENQNPAKSQSQNTVYTPEAKFEGRVTYASVKTPSWLYGRQDAIVVNADLSGSTAYGAMDTDTQVPVDCEPV